MTPKAALDLLNATKSLLEAVEAVERAKQEQEHALECLNMALFGHKDELTSDQALTVARTLMDISVGSERMKPRAIDAVVQVLTGQPSMNAAEIVKALEKLPASSDPKTYISFILSQNPEKFARDRIKGRGYYCLARNLRLVGRS
jgi:hypothetical protein